MNTLDEHIESLDSAALEHVSGGASRGSFDPPPTVTRSTGPFPPSSTGPYNPNGPDLGGTLGTGIPSTTLAQP